MEATLGTLSAQAKNTKIQRYKFQTAIKDVTNCVQERKD